MLRKQQLTRCRDCKLESVIPIEDECEERFGGWNLTVICTVCREVRKLSVTQLQAEEFDEALDKQSREVVRAIRRFERANMQDDIERFVNALNIDAILPEDFV